VSVHGPAADRHMRERPPPTDRVLNGQDVKTETVIYRLTAIFLMLILKIYREITKFGKHEIHHIPFSCFGD
jgi:hypothetical protein